MEYRKMDVESNASAQEFRSLAVKSTLSRWKEGERMDTLEKLIFLCVLALGKHHWMKSKE